MITQFKTDCMNSILVTTAVYWLLPPYYVFTYLVTPSAVYVDTLRSFEGVPTDPECANGGPFDTALDANDNFACNIPASRLTDGVLGENSSNFSPFSAWNRTTDMPRVFFQFPNTFPAFTFYIRQIDLYFYKSAALRVGLPDIRFDIADDASIMQDNLAVPYTIVNNQTVLDIDNQTVKVSLVDTLGQRANAYSNNIIVRLTFDFSSSDTLDWLLLSEVRMFNDTGEYILLTCTTVIYSPLYCSCASSSSSSTTNHLHSRSGDCGPP